MPPTLHTGKDLRWNAWMRDPSKPNISTTDLRIATPLSSAIVVAVAGNLTSVFGLRITTCYPLRSLPPFLRTGVALQFNVPFPTQFIPDITTLGGHSELLVYIRCLAQFPLKRGRNDISLLA
ncbi:hypothetical protein HPB50_017368 [Hyalomma asiaticum]|uniref:Uncharacterized protein n=1 Tax=Hyalomma asiaticum TaxID=266040 RepID=A0ACB7S1I0_HYAAI|nr:hypothetical protein HPB50_017368 [Hyalomma asiaticum]